MELLPIDVIKEIFLNLGDYSELTRLMSVSRCWLELIKTIDFPRSFFKTCLEKQITIAELHERYVNKKQFTIYLKGKCMTYIDNIQESYDEYTDNFSTHVLTTINYFPEIQEREIMVHFIHTEVDIYDTRCNQQYNKHLKLKRRVEDFILEVTRDLRVKKFVGGSTILAAFNEYKCDEETTNFFLQRRMGGRDLK